MNEQQKTVNGADAQGHCPTGAKDCYRTPILTRYGDIRSVVLAGTQPLPEDSGPNGVRRPGGAP
jgi:hypothetical protein